MLLASFEVHCRMLVSETKASGSNPGETLAKAQSGENTFSKVLLVTNDLNICNTMILPTHSSIHSSVLGYCTISTNSQHLYVLQTCFDLQAYASRFLRSTLSYVSL